MELGCEADSRRRPREGRPGGTGETHGYRRCRSEHAWVATPEKIYPPGSDPPLETQLAPLPLAEIQRRLAILTLPTARPRSPSADAFFFDDDVSAPDVSALSGARPRVRRRIRNPTRCADVVSLPASNDLTSKNKTAAHVLATRRLALLMGGVAARRPPPLGAPLRSTPAGADACDRLPRAPPRVRRLAPRRRESARGGRLRGVPDDQARRSGAVGVPGARPTNTRRRRRRRLSLEGEPRLDLWRSASEVLRAAAPDASFDAVAFTKAFRGSPHVDAKDVAHQHVFALGDFEGGELCYEDGEGGDGCRKRCSNGVRTFRGGFDRTRDGPGGRAGASRGWTGGGRTGSRGSAGSGSASSSSASDRKTRDRSWTRDGTSGGWRGRRGGGRGERTREGEGGRRARREVE